MAALAKSMRLLGVVAATAILFTLSSGCAKLQSRDNLNKGVTAFKAAQFSQAVDFFKTAADLDPTFPTARLYLAMAYMNQWIPGSDPAENKRFADSALEQFQKVLASNPDKDNAKIAISSIASIYFSEKDWDKAAEWRHKEIETDPASKEAYYTLGVIAWTRWLSVDRQARADEKMKADDPGPLKDKKEKAALKEKWGPILDQGIKDEQKALDVDPQYENAMAYMNLLIRYKADLDDTTEDYKKDVDSADNWMQKNLDTVKAKAEKKAADEAKGIKVK